METRGSEHHGGLFEKVSRWLANQRVMAADRQALTACSGEDMARLAQDVGVASGAELLDLIGRGPGSADLLREMADVLGVPLDAVRKSDPAILRELEVCCSRCEAKGRCVHELQDGAARETYAEYCPNAQTLDALRA